MDNLIIIPARLESSRLPNKPLAIIHGLPMIVHVMNRARESCAGYVFVATPDNEIFKVVKENGGEAVLTETNHSTGSDRVHEVFIKKLKKTGVTIITIEHNINIIMEISDNVLALDQGKSIAFGTPREIQKNKQVIDSYLGTFDAA